jgi:hypothetical protein
MRHTMWRRQWSEGLLPIGNTIFYAYPYTHA